MHSLTLTVTFALSRWNRASSRAYQVLLVWRGVFFSWESVARAQSVVKRKIRIASFFFDEIYMSPLQLMARQVLRHNPDVLFSAREQIYESVGGQYGDAGQVTLYLIMLYFLLRWYQFDWSCRDDLCNRPSFILRDDHNFFHVNM